jgi:hypothetical protein
MTAAYAGDLNSINLTLIPSDMREVLIKMLAAGQNVMMTGPPGCAKTQLAMQVIKDDLKCPYFLTHPIGEDPTYQTGLGFPAKERDHALLLPFGQMWDAMNSKGFAVWVVDDYGQANDPTKLSYMQLFHGGVINGKQINKKIVFLVITNRKQDVAGVRGVHEPVKSRFWTILEIATDANDFIAYGAKKGFHEAVLAWIKYEPDELFQFTPTLDLVNSPCPRTWEHVSDLLFHDFSPRVELPVYAGAIGRDHALKFLSFYRIYKSLIDPDLLVRDPSQFKMPECKERPAVLYAMSRSIVKRASKKNMDNIIKLAEMMPNEFSELMVKLIETQKPDLLETAPMVQYKIRHAATHLSQTAAGR